MISLFCGVVVDLVVLDLKVPVVVLTTAKTEMDKNEKCTVTESFQWETITTLSVISVEEHFVVCPFRGFHVTSRPPCWCPQTMKWRPCWCPDPILRELKAIIMLTSSFVFVEKHGC